MDYFIIIGLICLSAIFSGLTLGFFSLNKDDLERKADLGDKNAKKIFSLRKRGNLLLCTLLIGNVTVNSTLAIFLGSIASGVVAGFLATALIVIFGEIVPQAVFARHALLLGGKFSWLVKIFVFVLFPICWPMAWILDKILGEEIPTIYSKKELVQLIEDHEDSKKSDIDADEERIIKGALSFSQKKAEDIMTPRTAIFAIKSKEKLTDEMLKKISESGHSRIPIFEEKLENTIGILYVKDLINLDGAWSRKKISSVARKDVVFVDYNKKLDDLLNAFKKTRKHLFMVVDEFGMVMGLVTIEDVIEEIIGTEIVDEFDRYEDLQAMAIKKAKTKNLNKV